MFARLLQSLVEPVFRVIDQAVEDTDLRAQLKQQVQLRMMERQADIEKYTRDIIVAEAQGESWLQRNWRPIVMLAFAAIVGSYWFGLAPEYVVDHPELTERLFTILQIGIGGYIATEGGREMLSSWGRTREREAEERTRQEEARGLRSGSTRQDDNPL